MRKVFVLRYKNLNIIEAFENHDDAADAGAEYIVEIGTSDGWSEDKLNDEVSAFIKYKDCEIVELYCCEVKEAHQ